MNKISECVIDGVQVPNEDTITGKNVTQVDACEEVMVLDKLSHFISVENKDLQDLRAYLSRPRILATGLLDSSLEPYNLDISANTLVTIFPDLPTRLRGVQGLRGTLRFDLQVNTTPFHQGLALLSWQYQPFTKFNRAKAYYAAPHLPHVRLNLEDTTKVQLDVPFCGRYDFWPVNVTSSDNTLSEIYGTLGLTQMLASSSPAGFPTYKIMCSLHDIELVGVAPEVYTTVTVQAGYNAEKQKPLSTGVALASKGLSFVGKYVPSLASITEPASWFLGATSGALKAFGYSKPTSVEPPHQMIRFGNACEESADTPFVGHVLGLSRDNYLAVDGGIANTNVDEMAISHILSLPSFIFVGTFDVSYGINTGLYSTPISPCCFWFRNVANTPNVGNIPITTISLFSNQGAFYPSNIFALAQNFRDWHGSIKFTVSFAKTKFHGGRILAVYSPSPDQFSPSATRNFTRTSVGGSPVQPFGYSAIWDLRDGSTFEFVVPFVSNVHWRGFWESTGTFNMLVYEPLLCPSTVTQKIDYSIEVSALPDFELAVPHNINYPLLDAPPTGKLIMVQADVGTVDLVSNNLKLDGISQYTIGEVCRSVKTLIETPGPVGNSDTNIVANNFLPLYPWWVTRDDMQLLGPSYSTYFSKCYTWATGSTDYHSALLGSTTSSFTVNYAGPNGNDTGTDYAGISPLLPSNQLVIQPIGQNSVHVRLPAYQTYPKVAIGDTLFNFAQFWGANPSASGVAGNRVKALAFLNIVFSSNCKVVTRINAGDDARLMGYIGPSLAFITSAPA